ncbi:M14 family metallopeptidase [Cytobacillus solani]|uniref:Peptidase M14 domain-containing protein n=1 Tax=Cytobacillus solani TaxID=1637975 RepID=A0A0Q3QUG2_9BACI|nr:M14 family metallopeptidase [Cytobacillus solani]KQL21406.1 hypothetical protein AN957_24530 [Cytobacillus solani]
MENIFSIWTKDGLLRDKNGDGVIDGTNVWIDLPDYLAPEGLIDFCARLGFETTSLSFCFFEPSEEAVKLCFVHSEAATDIRLENNQLMIRYQSEQELSDLLKLLAAMDLEQAGTKSDVIELRDGRLYAGQLSIPTIDYPNDLAAAVPEINNLSDLWSFSGIGKSNEASPAKLFHMNIGVEKSLMTAGLLREICYFAARSAMYSTEIVFPVTGNKEASLQLEVLEGDDPILELVKPNVLQLRGRKENMAAAAYQLARAKHWSEGGVFGYWEQKHQLSQKKEPPLLFEMQWSDEKEVDVAFDHLKREEDLAGTDIEIFLSEPAEVRRRLEEEWRAIFPQVHSLTIRSAFKAGLHWLMEEMIPSLQPYKEIEIKVREEAGEKGLELPIRWIQELYPADRLIEEEIGLKADLVTYKLEGNLSHTYELYGLDEQGEKHFISSLDVPVSRLPYIDGKHDVYPASSAVRIRKNGVEEEQLIQTDRERFYRFYADKVLPKLRDAISDYHPGQGHTRPLFDRIEIDVWMSEEEIKLQVDEERVSALEALHEDLYFNTLDYFAYLGEELEGKPFDAPGGVHPFMHVRVGEKPEARIRVYGWEDKQSENWVTTAILFNEAGDFSKAALTNDGEEIALSIEASEKPDRHLHPYVNEWLNKHPSYRVLYPDHSYRGHAIPIIECFLDTGEEYDSPLKMTLFKKTIFIEAGHHSNEVSSTPAILQLLERACERSDHLLKEMNIVLLPLANPDGYELMTKLTKEHPEWKHHAARYNAVGLEYSFVRFQETVFGEANIYPEVLRRWAPDTIVDDHGIPSHEWVQPFAGYNSPPRFPVSYFLPSAKIYGIGRLSTGAFRTRHEENLDAIVNEISQAIRGTEIEKENSYWKQRFRKYGNEWLPEVFPIEEAPGIHFYRQPTVAPSYSTLGVSRYPEWIGAEIISEAADEVVYGDVLQSCVEAHIVFDLAILDVLQRARIDVKRQTVNGLSYERARPIQLL